MALRGIDIASYQKTMDCSKVDADFIIIKTSEDNHYVNPTWKQQAQQTLSSGKLLGLYHYIGGSGVDVEVANYVHQCKDYAKKALICVDWERGSNTKYGNVAYLASVVRELEQELGVPIVVYCGPNEMKMLKKVLPECKFWIAQYAYASGTGHGSGYQNTPWNEGAYDCLIRQYQSEGHIAGYSGNVDLNKLYGDANAWRQAMGAAGSAAQPAQQSAPQGSTLDLAVGVMQGKYGDGDTRKAKLGSRYSEVQSFINHVSEASVTTLASEVVAGRYGNGDIRKVILGSKYNAVMEIINGQHKTNAKPQIAVDGKLGPATIKAWQSRLGVAADGVIGPNTIRAIQKWAGSVADGIMGPNTRKAVQKKLGVTADGSWGPQTIKALQTWLNS